MECTGFCSRVVYIRIALSRQRGVVQHGVVKRVPAWRGMVQPRRLAIRSAAQRSGGAALVSPGARRLYGIQAPAGISLLKGQSVATQGAASTAASTATNFDKDAEQCFATQSEILNILTLSRPRRLAKPIVKL